MALHLQVNEAELPLIAILGPTGAKVFSFTGCMPAPDLATALAEFLDANDLESSDAVKLKVRPIGVKECMNARAKKMLCPSVKC
jgi:hypothetical protein